MNADLWRVFKPTWRFFDRVGARPQIFVRGAGQDWRRVLSPPRRRWFHVLFNPQGNAHHADQNLVLRLLDEIARGDGDATAVQRLVSYRILIRRLQSEEPFGDFRIDVDGELVLSAHFDGTDDE